MVSKTRLVGAAIMILPWLVFLAAAKGFGFVATWMLVVTLVISAFGLTLLISPNDRPPAGTPSTKPDP